MMQCDHALFLITSCAQSAVPVSVRHAIVRVATSQAGIAAVVQVAEHPRSPDAGSGRVAVEGCLWEHHTTLAEIFRRFSYQGPAAPLALRAFTPLLPSQARCAQSAVPESARHAKVRAATRQAGSAAGVQGAEHPRSPDAGSGRAAVEGCLTPNAAATGSDTCRPEDCRIFGYCGILNVFPACSCASRN